MKAARFGLALRAAALLAAALLAAVCGLPAWGLEGLPPLHLPVACPAGAACFVQNHVDRDSGPAYRDFRCGGLSYDRHHGTDIRVSDLRTMRQGVAVLAAAAGTVSAIRDGEPDTGLLDGARPVPGRDGGNLVRLEHDNGWQTLYAHLRNGSVLVKVGDQVAAGQPLGLIGLSGRSEFPHVHFELRRDKQVIDPFSRHADAPCDGPHVSLWDEATQARLAYRAPGLIAHGFTDKPPSKAAVLENASAPMGALPENPDTLVYWAQLYGLAAGDTGWLRLRAPDGRIVAENRLAQTRSKAVWLAWAGVRRPDPGGWEQGRYTAELLVQRADTAHSSASPNAPLNVLQAGLSWLAPADTASRSLPQSPATTERMPAP